jgi:hypothetical protein
MDDFIIHQKNNKSYEAPLGAKNDLENERLRLASPNRPGAPGATLLLGFFLGQFAIAYYWVTYRLINLPGCTGVTKYTISQIGLVYYLKNRRQWFSVVLVNCVIHYIMGEPCIWTYREMSDILRNE